MPGKDAEAKDELESETFLSSFRSSLKCHLLGQIQWSAEYRSTWAVLYTDKNVCFLVFAI